MTVNYPCPLEEVRPVIAQFRAMGLSSLVINRLLGRNIRSLKDLGRLTESDLRRIPGIGDNTIKQLRLYLRPDRGADEPDSDTFIATMVLAPSLIEEVDCWVTQNFERLSRADAIGTLIRLGLQAQTPVGET